MDELIQNSRSIDGRYFVDDGLYEAADRFDTWIEQVTQALEAANMAEELDKWKEADDTRRFSPGGSSSVEIDEADFRNDVRAMRAMLLGIRDRLDLVEVERTPFLSGGEISNARKMSELYVILHCYENSVRRLVENVFVDKYGENWWERVTNTQMNKLVEGRQQKEKGERWLLPRGGTSLLYYLEWGDLTKLIRKEVNLFLPYIGTLRFVENRFEELESLRNIVAHNGVLPSDEDFQRVKIWFGDWCRQLANYQSTNKD